MSSTPFGSDIASVINKLAQEFSGKHNSADIAQDILNLFQDIIKFFAGREEELVNLEAMNPSQKEALYTEIITIIKLLKKMKLKQDKDMLMSELSQNIQNSLTGTRKIKSSDKLNLSPHEALKIKEQLALMGIQNMLKQSIKTTAKAPKSAQLDLDKIKDVFIKNKVSNAKKDPDKLKAESFKNRLQETKPQDKSLSK